MVARLRSSPGPSPLEQDRLSQELQTSNQPVLVQIPDPPRNCENKQGDQGPQITTHRNGISISRLLGSSP